MSSRKTPGSIKPPPRLKPTIQRETPYIYSRLLVATKLILEASLIIKSESKRLRNKFSRDNLVWTIHFQEVVKFWNESEMFEEFDQLFELQSIKTYDDVLRAVAQVSKRNAEKIQGIRVSTGCAPDPNKANL